MSLWFGRTDIVNFIGKQFNNIKILRQQLLVVDKPPYKIYLIVSMLIKITLSNIQNLKLNSSPKNVKMKQFTTNCQK